MRILSLISVFVLFFALGCGHRANQAVNVGLPDEGQAPVVKNDKPAEPTPEDVLAEFQKAEEQRAAAVLAEQKRKNAELLAQQQAAEEEKRLAALLAKQKEDDERLAAEAKKRAEEEARKNRVDTTSPVNTASSVNTTSPVDTAPSGAIVPAVNTASPIKQGLSNNHRKVRYVAVKYQTEVQPPALQPEDKPATGTETKPVVPATDGKTETKSVEDKPATGTETKPVVPAIDDKTETKSVEDKPATGTETKPVVPAIDDKTETKSVEDKPATGTETKPVVPAIDDKTETKSVEDKPATGTEIKPAARPEGEKRGSGSENFRNAAPRDLKPTDQIRFNFRYAPWKDVIEWFAEQAGLSLQADNVPQGTLNLTDSKSYTPTEAIDILNSYLLFREYTVLRKGNSLFVIYLPDGIPANLLEPVLPNELDNRGKYEICRCVFALTRTTPDVILAEVDKLIGAQGSAYILPKSQQIIITETAGTLRTIRDIIKRLDDPDELSNGKIQTLEPQNLAADEALGIMRKLLAIDENDIALRTAVDATGKKIWMSGRSDMIERAKDIIQTLDDSFGTNTADGAVKPQFEVHETGSADPATVLAVLQTLLAGTPDVRLSLDAKTGGIAALGRPAVQATIKAAIQQMQLNTPQFDVILLKRISPLSAVESIKKFFETTSPSSTATSTGARAAGTGINTTAPTVEADTAGNQIIVRGTLVQIQQIRALLAKLGEDGSIGASVPSTERVIPLNPAAIPYIIEQLKETLPKVNPKIKLNAPPSGVSGRMLYPVQSVFVKYQVETGESTVTLTITPTGLLVTGDDSESLNQVEQLLRLLTDEKILGKTKLVVYYLKHTTADVVAASLQTLLGTVSPTTEGVNGAGGGIPDDQRSAIYALLASGGTIEKTGTVSIATDSRLNALLIQANPVDHKTIVKLLELLDQEGLSNIPSRAKPRLIGLHNMRASEALGIVETVYKERLQGNAGSNPQAQQAQNNGARARGGAAPVPQLVVNQPPMMGVQPNDGRPMSEMIPQLMARMNTGGGGAPKEAEAKMTLGVEEHSNSLIVSAPESLFKEVKEFVEELDAIAVQTETVIETVALKNISPDVAKQTLKNMLGESVTFTANTAVQNNFGGGYGNRGGTMGNGSTMPMGTMPMGNGGTIPMGTMPMGGNNNPFLNMFNQGMMGGGGFGNRAAGAAPGGGGGFGGNRGGGFGGGNR